jgi:hypothetical protein
MIQGAIREDPEAGGGRGRGRWMGMALFGRRRSEADRRTLRAGGDRRHAARRYALPFAPGLVEVLCLDLPDKVSTVGDDDLGDLDPTELRAIGRRNLQSERIDERSRPSEGIVLLQGASMFVASQLLNPEFLPLEVGPAPRGAVVAIPHRHTLFFHAIAGAESAEPISRLGGFVAQIDRDERPGGLISPHTCYVPPAGATAGVQQIPQLDDDGRMRILADGAFLEALEG